jgi:hypothetical protein
MAGSKGQGGNRHKRKNPGGAVRTHGERIIHEKLDDYWYPVFSMHYGKRPLVFKKLKRD